MQNEYQRKNLRMRKGTFASSPIVKDSMSVSSRRIKGYLGVKVAEWSWKCWSQRLVCL